jgi:ubiquitin carboxyl-terminal hydrolase MINDY-1/2
MTIIGNILILRKDIEILPRDRQTVSYEFLAQLVGEYLLMRCPDVDLSAALSMMPLTTSTLHYTLCPKTILM